MVIETLITANIAVLVIITLVIDWPASGKGLLINVDLFIYFRSLTQFSVSAFIGQSPIKNLFLPE
jgi:hypothetical protein